MKDKKISKKWIVLISAVTAAITLAIATFFAYQFFSSNDADIAARVNREVITVVQLDAEVARIAVQSPAVFDMNEEGEVRKMLLDEFIDRTLLEQEAKKEGVTASDEDIEEQIDIVKSAYVDEQALNEALSAAGYTLDTLRAQIAYDLLVQGLLDKRTSETSLEEIVRELRTSARIEILDPYIIAYEEAQE